MKPTKQFLKTRNALINIVEVLEQVAEESRSELRTFIDEEMFRLGFGDCQLSAYWPCTKESPVEYCLYDAEDVMRDQCIFCGEPEERK